jgi:hypothetical protein
MRHPNVAPLMTPSGPLGNFIGSVGRRGVTEMLDEGVPPEYVYPIIDSINSLAYGSALLKTHSTDDDAQVDPGSTVVRGIDEVLRSAPKSPDKLFEMQVDALLEGWTNLLEREKADAEPRARKRKVPNSHRAG